MTTNQDVLLEVRDLAVHFPLRGRPAALGRARRVVRAVDGVSLAVREGEMVVLVGESGAGKTTVASAMLRMIPATAGSVRFRGQDITAISGRRLRPLRRRMQMVYQDPYESLDPRFRVVDTVEEPLLIHRVGDSKADRKDRVLRALTMVELADPESYLDRRPGELSGGQRQRVALAASLVLQPEVLIADEPVSMLDMSMRAGVLRLLDRLRRDHGMAIIMITHDLPTAARFADRIAVMYLGRVVEEGPAQAVADRPRHPYTRALLKAVPHRYPQQGQTSRLPSGEAPDPSDIPVGCRFNPRCPISNDDCRRTDPHLDPPVDDSTWRHSAACILTRS